MKDEQLKIILEKMDIDECEEVKKNYIYYIQKPIRQRVNYGDGRFRYFTDEYEFLIITNGREKQAIILRCGYGDLHWYVLKKWRNRHVLSDALRTGIIHKVWPENQKITCCYNYDDYDEEKYSMTQHLADIAGLILE